MVHHISGPAQHVRAMNATMTSYPRDASLHQLLARQSAERPAAPAARYGARQLSYGELGRRAAALAARLERVGVRPGDRVGVSGGRCLEALIACAGILRTGAAYVPLDESHPSARLRAMAEDAGVHVVVTLPGSTCRVRGLRAALELEALPAEPAERAAEFEGAVSGAEQGAAVDAGDCAYVVFTSGTSGRPKAVEIPHRGAVRLAVGASHLTLTPQDRVLHGYDLSSDASTIEVWSALLNGACLVLLDREVLVSPRELGRALARERVSVAFLTTSVLHHTARSHPEAFAGLRFLSAGGEALDPDLARAVLAKSQPGRFVNFYGPTENSVISTAHEVSEVPEGAVSVPIGRPVANSTCYVVRPDGTLAGPGEEGELLVGGDGLALGYSDPELTARCFVRAPCGPSDARAYRTGDQVRWLPDGTLEFRGRLDRQVKAGGYRVELDEVEGCLRGQPEVAEAVVECTAPVGASAQAGDGPGKPANGSEGADVSRVGKKVLLAFVTAADPLRPPDPRRMRAALASWLPRHALPAAISVVPHFPVAANGKVDRRRLLADHTAASCGQPMVPGPSNRRALPEGDGRTKDSSLLHALSRIWEHLLRTSPGPGDSFFDLGGDSLLASEMVIRTLKLLGLDASAGSILVRGLLDSPSLSGFAAAAHELRCGATDQGRGGGVDFAREAALGPDLPQPPAGPPPRTPQREILLTGASGFVGAFLLDRLLRLTTARVHCPVRSRNDEHARRRVLENLAKYHLAYDGPQERLVCFPADLGAPGLGLESGQFAYLSDSLDLIVHAGALVNFLYPYSALRAANVEGTREIIAMAAPRRVPVHFVSTIAVVAGFGAAGVRHVPEDRPLEHAERLTMGYAESKWVGERLLQAAADQGLPVAIHRPYEVTGERRSGICNTATAISSLFQTITETGVAPDVDLPLDFVPVDYLADAITHIVTTRPAQRRVYHLTNPRPAMLRDMLARMRASGHRISELPYQQWVGELVDHVGRHPGSPTAPFVSLCVDHGHMSDLSVKEMYFQDVFPALGRENVEAALSDSDLTCPPVDDGLLDLYLEFFYSTEFLRRPRARAAVPPVAGGAAARDGGRH
jgi:amino acid adenylation domain-containing protein/thioester reductase-like protein